MNSSKTKPYSKAIVKLLKGIVEKNDVVWNDVLNYQSDIQNYIAVMGLELIVKKDEGFAFVKQFNPSLIFNCPFFLLSSTLRFSFAALCTTNFSRF